MHRLRGAGASGFACCSATLKSCLGLSYHRFILMCKGLYVKFLCSQMSKAARAEINAGSTLIATAMAGAWYAATLECQVQVPPGGCCVRPCGSNEIVACAQGCQQCIDIAYFFVFSILRFQAIFGRVEAQACSQPLGCVVVG